MSIFKVLLTLLSFLLISLLGYSIFKNNRDNQKENLPRVIHIEQMTLPMARKDENENEKTILSHLKKYIDKNKQYTDSLQTNEDKILKELQMFTAQNISQEDLIKSIKDESSLIKKEIQTLSANIDKKIDKEVKTLKKDIKKNTYKINKKIALVNKKTIDKIQKSIKNNNANNNNYIISTAFELKENEKKLAFGEIETIAASKSYKIDNVAPIKEPIDVSVEDTNNIDDLNFVQTLGVVDVSQPYLSTDEVM